MNPFIPASAILVYSVVLLWIYFGILPDPSMLWEYIKTFNSSIIFLVLFLIILLESIIYLWFYLPWQFIAVLVVIGYAAKIQDIVLLSLVSILAVTLWAIINYSLWYFLSKNSSKKQEKIDYKNLLLSMIHINTIALYMFDQGQKKAPKKIIFLTGLLNFPYYLLIIWITYLLKNKVLSVSENSFILYGILFLWLWISLYQNKRSKI